MAKVVRHDVAKGTITYVEEDSSEETVKVTGGRCKLQWKPDMGMRWAALGVDYEMYGKDHLTPAQLYDAICRIAGGMPPEQFMFELFLDEKGQKISKSKGNGITIEEWLNYGPAESISLFMFQKPRVAKRLYFDVIPKAVDDYLAFLEAYPPRNHRGAADGKSGLAHPWRKCAGRTYPVSFALLLNLVSASNAHNRDVLWGFIRAYSPDAASPKQSRPRPAGRLCAALLRGFREAAKSIARPTITNAPPSRSSPDPRGNGRRTRRRNGPKCGL